MLSKQPENLTLLIVDDDDVEAMGILRALKKLSIQHTIVRARDGIEGLEKLRECVAARQPFLVLLDLNMPRMDGLEMLAEIRKDPDLTTTVVFVLTTSRATEDLVIAYKNHVAGYMLKTEGSEGLLRAMDMLRNYWRTVELIA
jgi:CheY-like chemotaxis protein